MKTQWDTKLYSNVQMNSQATFFSQTTGVPTLSTLNHVFWARSYLKRSKMVCCKTCSTNVTGKHRDSILPLCFLVLRCFSAPSRCVEARYFPFSSCSFHSKLEILYHTHKHNKTPKIIVCEKKEKRKITNRIQIVTRRKRVRPPLPYSPEYKGITVHSATRRLYVFLSCWPAGAAPP